ncbi:MAG: hypothetical protein IMZ71_00965 [Chloroflexi bacterium]|nr:hypothetical protein [Chloroflexota bacterium]MBE3140147.1 hypothetical protein [Thermoplasmata archaeon]
MDSIEKQIKEAIGIAAYWALMKIVKGIEIAIDGDDKQITIYRNGKEPVRIGFEQIERFINESH